MTKRAARRTESLRMGSLAAKSEVQADADRLSPKPEARTLLGCMWLQFARAIGGDKWSRVCENGKRWSEIGGGIARRPFRQALLLRNLQGGRAREEKVRGAPTIQIQEEAFGYRTGARHPIGTVKGWIVQ